MPIWLTAIDDREGDDRDLGDPAEQRGVREAHLARTDFDRAADEARDQRGQEQDDGGDDEVRDPEQYLVQQLADLGHSEHVGGRTRKMMRISHLTSSPATMLGLMRWLWLP